MQEAYCVCKLKHDIRVESKVDLARREVEEILRISVSDLRVLPTLFRIYPFSKLDDKIVDRMTRLLYLGKLHGFISGLRSFDDLMRLAKNATYLREIYAVLLTQKDEIPEIVSALKPSESQEERTCDEDRFMDVAPNILVYNQALEGKSYLTTVFLIPNQTILEYASEVVKLPPVTFTKQFTDLAERIDKMEAGVKKGLDELLDHLTHGAKRMPWLGLFKEHIGDYVDWAFSEFRTWGLHFIHKHEGKADPWLARSALNLLGVEEGCTVLDPFCGSGTFIADAPLMGFNAVGVDINPLSTMIARAKCSIADIPLSALRGTLLKLHNRPSSDLSNKERLKAIRTELGDKDKLGILDKDEALLQILTTKDRIDEFSEDKLVKDFLYTILSRSIVELLGKKFKSSRVMSNFLRDALDFYLYVYASQEILGKLNFRRNSKCRIFTTNAWSVNTVLEGKVDGIVTSPPYFDALDYLGSSSLPIAILGLDGGDDHLQAKIIGSSRRIASDSDLLLHDLLPDSSQQVIRGLTRGGREKKARIILHYLIDLSDCLASFYQVLNEGGRIIFVVGKYHHWKLGNSNARLDGAQVLIDIGEKAGLTLEDELTHNISKIEAGNRIREESIIIWRKNDGTSSKRDPNRSKRILALY